MNDFFQERRESVRGGENEVDLNEFAFYLKKSLYMTTIIWAWMRKGMKECLSEQGLQVKSLMIRISSTLNLNDKICPI